MEQESSETIFKLKPDGFSLMELLAVLMIMGVLATMALPSFRRAAERAKVRDAQAVLGAIYSAERVYYLDQSAYGTDANLYNNHYLVDPDAGWTGPGTGSNPDWDFSVETDAAPFRAVATRTGSSYNGKEIEIDNTFNGEQYGGTHPLRDP